MLSLPKLISIGNDYMTVYDALKNLTSLAENGYGNMELVSREPSTGLTFPVCIFSDIAVANPHQELGHLQTVAEGQVYVAVYSEY
jgi:hypothetical protein